MRKAKRETHCLGSGQRKKDASNHRYSVCTDPDLDGLVSSRVGTKSRFRMDDMYAWTTVYVSTKKNLVEVLGRAKEMPIGLAKDLPYSMILG